MFIVNNKSIINIANVDMLTTGEYGGSFAVQTFGINDKKVVLRL